MKNLKKVLAFVVVFAMMFTFGVSASAFPDVADTASYAEATTILSSLGLMIGDDLGNFNPDKVLTRAEATALVMRAKGLESAAAGAAGATQFADVAPTHWASGYINLAAQSGVVAGYGNGMFGPEDQVLYEQFVKMIVAALGYEPMAAKNGGYPSGYLIVAAQKNITKNAPGAAGQPAVRSTVAVLLFNSLDVSMMRQSVFTEGAEEFIEDASLTLLDDYLNIDKYEGIVSAVKIPAIGKTDEDTRITITWQKPEYDKDGKFTGYVSDTETFNQAEAKNATALLGNEVVAYVAEDSITRIPELVAIAARTGRNTVLSVDYSQLAGAPAKDKFTYVDYLAKETDNVPTRVRLEGASYFLNGVVSDLDSVYAFLSQTGESEVIGKAEFLDNDADGLYEYVFVTDYTGAGEYLVATVDAENQELIDKNGETISDIDLESEVSSYAFYKNGEVASFEDIAAGDVLTIVKSAADEIITVYASDVVVEGIVSEASIDEKNKNNNVYSINGVDYKASANCAALKINDEGKFYLNVDGRIAFKEAVRAAADNYAYLLAYDITDGISGQNVEVKFINAAGEWGVYEFASKVIVNDEAVEIKDAIKELSADKLSGKDAADFGILAVNATREKEDAAWEYAITAGDAFFQYQLNSAGKVSKIWTAVKGEDPDAFSYDETLASKMTYKASTNKLGSVYLSDATKVFYLKDAYLKEADERAVTITSPVMFRDAEEYTVSVYDYDEEGYPAVLVVKSENELAVDEATHPLVITKVTKGTNAAGYEAAKIYGYQAGEAVEAQGAEELSVTDKAGKTLKYTDLSAGDVAIFSVDPAGDIDNIKVIMTAAEAEAAVKDMSKAMDPTGDEEEVLEYFGLVTKRESNNRVTIKTATAEDVYTLRGADLNFYTVNINRAPYKVADGGLSDITSVTETTNNGKVASFAYVREFEGTPVAVVIYQVTVTDALTNAWFK